MSRQVGSVLHLLVNISRLSSGYAQTYLPPASAFKTTIQISQTLFELTFPFRACYNALNVGLRTFSRQDMPVDEGQ